MAWNMQITWDREPSLKARKSPASNEPPAQVTTGDSHRRPGGEEPPALLYLERVGAALWPHSSLLPGGAFNRLDFFPSCGLRRLLTCLPHRTLTLGRVTFPDSGPGTVQWIYSSELNRSSWELPSWSVGAMGVFWDWSETRSVGVLEGQGGFFGSRAQATCFMVPPALRFIFIFWSGIFQFGASWSGPSRLKRASRLNFPK